MKIHGIQCLKCLDVIYSVANHDFHECSCGACFVDAGRYDKDTNTLTTGRYGYPTKESFREVELQDNGDITAREYYDDWNRSLTTPRKYGVVKANTSILLEDMNQAIKQYFPGN
jgi:hypothetical protein